jgi:hypothetical protein
MPVITTTEAMPTIKPSSVSAVRSLLRNIFSKAKRK